ncbi:ATP-binding cassette sub-family C member 3-like [Ruditapes philippinarum]|uniref:ATP-binding cassette sub-family C member 3-like n=1 Tax=Ruditapes philippinarum TaxID=129788 RepID=UPI00295C25C6|nr:ATP-binding cassette sub-family C member 3-like [Ruditapes philippinarum]
MTCDMILKLQSKLYELFQRFYLPTARQMRRTESVKRSPVYNHFSETITGASVIRAYRCPDRFVRESRQRIDENIKFYYAAISGARWVGWRLELMGNFVAFLAALFALVSYDLNGAQVGMSVTYAVQLTITLNFGVFAISEMEMNIISAERVTEYTTLQPEASWDKGSSSHHLAQWPQFGRIDFQGYKTRYREGLDLVLHGIHCTIREGEKVGIVGRTGAGKSSLALALFRLIESADGAIMIDGVDISTLGLHELRQKLTILPQSVGQRQLVCLARTLLHKTKILILDEATAAVDMETDDLIQDTIRKQFSECTILAVAHRLSTVMDYDRIMVLDKGKLAEFDTPAFLLDNTESIFYGMAKDAGIV